MAPTRPRRPSPRLRIDFHSHSYLTDGRTSATDMWNEADALEHRALALTDHLSLEDPAPLLERLRQEARAFEDAPLRPLVGVELTKVPPKRIADAARSARRAGAEIVLVHGETLLEHVPAGTNHAAIASGLVDVLAHPGLLDPRDAERARANSVALEISGRRGHSLGNGRVAALGLAAGADLVVDSDAHDPSELIPLALARRIALGAGIPEPQVERVVAETPLRILRRLGRG